MGFPSEHNEPSTPLLGSRERPTSGAAGLVGRRRRRRGQEVQAELGSAWWAFGCLAIAAFASLLALGAVHVPPLLAVTPFAIAAGAFALLQDRARFSAPAVVLVALAAYSAFQAMPLPLSVMRVLDPASAGIWESALRPFGDNVRAVTLSLDPGASMVEALKWFSYAGVFVAAASVVRRRELRWMCGLVFASAVLAAVVTLGHRLLGAEAFFGVYRPVYAAPKFATAPLLNANNLAGYLNLGAFAGIGLMVSRRPILPIWLLGLAVAVVVGVSAVSGSRAGLASLLLGFGVMLLALRVNRFGGRTVPRLLTLLVAGVLVSGLALFWLGANGDVYSALFHEGSQKLALISWTKPLVAQHPWFGIGRGSFETAFPAYRADEGHHVYQFAENFVMQWCSEWGIPVALGGMFTLGWLLRPGRLGLSRSPLALGMGIGVAVLLIQNLLDLALEVTAVGVLLFIALGALWANGSQEEASQPAGEMPRWRRPGIAFVVAGAALWTCALLRGTHTPVHDRRALAEAFRAIPSSDKDDSAQRLAFVEQLRLAVHRHPADPFLPLVGAIEARASGKNPLPWLSRAIERDPMAGRPYLVLADVLARLGTKEQSLLSIRLAVEREEALMGQGVRLALSMTQAPEELERAVPDGSKGATMLTSFASQPELREHRSRLLEAALVRDGRATKPRLLLAEDLLELVTNGQAACSGAGADDCTRRIAALAAEVERLDSSLEAPVVLKARLLANSGREGEALALLSAQCPRFSAQIECLRWQVNIARRARDSTAFAKAASAYLAAACEKPQLCAGAAAWLGAQYEVFGENVQALRMFERAAQESETPQSWAQVERVANRLGFVAAAKHAHDRIRRASPAPASPQARSEALDRERLRELVDEAAPH